MEKHQSFVTPHLRHSIFGFLSSSAILPRFLFITNSCCKIRKTLYEGHGMEIWIQRTGVVDVLLFTEVKS